MREEREKTNNMQQSKVYYQLLSQHVSGIIMPFFRRTKTLCYCIRCTALVLLDVVGSGCGALSCRMRAAEPNKTKYMQKFLKFIFGIKLNMFRTVPLSIIRRFSL